jgi:broad specificity phosphatase PhoE
MEQEWGQNMEDRSGYKDKIEEYRDNYGHFYYRFRDGGESCADVYYRMSDFLDTMWRDFSKDNFPDNAIIVTHGMAMRLFVMRWFHYSVEQFERIKNPKNCGFFVMELDPTTDKYILKTELLEHKVRHPFQFPEYKTLPKD